MKITTKQIIFFSATNLISSTAIMQMTIAEPRREELTDMYPSHNSAAYNDILLAASYPSDISHDSQQDTHSKQVTCCAAIKTSVVLACVIMVSFALIHWLITS